MSKIGKRAILILLALPIGFNVMAQEIKKLTLEDLIPGGETYRYAENLYGLQWWGDVCIKPSTDTIYTVQPRTGKETVLTTLGQINKVLADNKAGKLPTPYSIRYPWADKPQMLLKVSGKYIVYDFENNRIVSTLKLKDKAANEDYCVANGNVAYTVNNNLYVNEQAITDEPEGIVCGQSVHRNEFGINKGTFWSPKGNLLAFYRMDESMVTQYPLVDITARVGEVNNVRYPMAGMTSHQVKVGVYNPSTGKTIYLNAGDPTDRYFTNISWSPDEKSIYLIELNRDQNHAVLCQYDATTGKLLSKLLEETHPKYVEPQHPIVFLPWDSSKFIYQSQRDGYNHLYLCDLTSSLKGEWKSDAAGGKHIEYIPTKQLTEGKWLVGDILGFNAKRKEVIFQGVDGTGSNNFAVNVNTGKCSLPFSFRSITEGEHNGMLSASGSYLIDRYSTPTLPRRIDIVDTKSLKTVNLLTAKDPYEGYEMPTIETGTIKADDGTTDLYYRLTKPADFDPNKKYPVIVYVYGGPHAQLVTGGWLNGSRGWDIYMANKGYIMFTLDNRGSANRGLEFENATFRRLGIEEGKDQVKGIEFLKSLPYIDGNRIGVHGWSFGGHMTTALLLRYPEIFKVGVAGGPVIDWGYYEVMYGERYMDTPETPLLLIFLHAPPFLAGNEHGSRLRRPLGLGGDAAQRHFIHQPPRARIAHAQPPLEHADGNLPRVHGQLNRLGEHFVHRLARARRVGGCAAVLVGRGVHLLDHVLVVIRAVEAAHKLDDALHLVVGNEAALHARRLARALRRIEHVALAQQLFRAAGIEDRPAVDLAGHRERDSARDVRLNHARDDVDRRPLRRDHQMDARRARQLRQSADGFLHLAGGDHHQIGQLVDDDGDIGHLLEVRVRCSQLIEGLDVADVVLRKEVVAALHLHNRPAQRRARLLRVGHDRHEQVRNPVVDGKLDNLRVDEDEPHFLRLGAEDDGVDDRVDADGFARARRARSVTYSPMGL